MNNPNPFIPQGTLLDQVNKKRARAKVAIVACFGCTILLVGPLLLLNGCRRSDTANTENTPQDTGPAPAVADTNNTTPNLSPVGTASTSGSNATPLVAIPPTPPPMPPTPPPAPAETEYTVVKGDHLGDIAKHFNVKLKDLLAANPSVVPTKMPVGTKLKIPAPATDSTTAMAATDGGDTYVVKAGDNLTTIAHSHHTTVKDLMALNNLKTTAIKAGAKLKLPTGASTTSSPMESTPATTTTTTASNPTPDAPVMR